MDRRRDCGRIRPVLPWCAATPRRLLLTSTKDPDSPGPAEGTDIGSVYQQDALRMCESFVLSNTSWASHHDVDEFLMVNAPGWSSPIPIAAESADESPASSKDAISSSSWRYPLHERFQTSLDRATCVPLLRLPFQNYGLRELPLDGYITDRQTVRDRIPANFHTYGKVRLLKLLDLRASAWTDVDPLDAQMFIHSASDPARGGWMGPREFSSLSERARDLALTRQWTDSCKVPPGTVILDAHGKDFKYERGAYPYDGLPLPQEALYLVREWRTLPGSNGYRSNPRTCAQITCSARSKTASGNSTSSLVRRTTGGPATDSTAVHVTMSRRTRNCTIRKRAEPSKLCLEANSSSSDPTRGDSSSSATLRFGIAGKVG